VKRSTLCAEVKYSDREAETSVLTVHSLDGGGAVGSQRLGARLTDALLPVKSDSVAGRERLPANREHQNREHLDREHQDREQ